MIDLKPLIDPTFWFDLNPLEFSPSFVQFFFIFFAVMILLGALIRIVGRRRKEDKYMRMTYMKIGTMSLTMGALGLIWYFLTYEEIYLLGARFWGLILGIGTIVWAVKIFRFIKVEVPAHKKQLAHKAESNKYLPKSNRRK